MMVWQYELTDKDHSTLVCWLDGKLRLGQSVTLEELPERKWTITHVYSTAMQKQELHKPWRVGGLV